MSFAVQKKSQAHPGRWQQELVLPPEEKWNPSSFFCATFGLEKVFPQIAIATGVLTSNRGEGDEPLWPIGRGTRVPLQGEVDVVPWLGAIAGCHSGVLWLQGGGDDQLWGSGRSAIAGCHCRVPLSVSYFPPIFRATNVTQTPKKTRLNFVLSFL